MQRRSLNITIIKKGMAMEYVPRFELDTFISYHQVDNKPLDYSGGEVRWVSHLKEQLQRRVDLKPVDINGVQN